MSSMQVVPYLCFNGQCEAVVMPLAKTFWAERFGMVIDRFGTPWTINCESEGQ